MIVKVNATISAESETLRDLEGLEASLWDADLVADDKLATAFINAGSVEFLWELEDASSLDSPRESLPDLYMKVTNNIGETAFHSETHPGVDFLEKDPVTGDALTTLNLIFTQRK